jgi:hypothetical protein
MNSNQYPTWFGTTGPSKRHRTHSCHTSTFTLPHSLCCCGSCPWAHGVATPTSGDTTAQKQNIHIGNIHKVNIEQFASEHLHHIIVAGTAAHLSAPAWWRARSAALPDQPKCSAHATHICQHFIAHLKPSPLAQQLTCQHDPLVSHPPPLIPQRTKVNKLSAYKQFTVAGS